MRKEHRAVDIARYIINKCHNEGYLISNLKLQKLLYFTQGFSLALNKNPIFSDEIEAWDFGPVVPAVYREYKMYGANEIPKITSYFDVDYDSDTFLDEIIVSEDIFTQKERMIMNSVVDKFGKLSANALVSVTHKQSPWITSYSKGRCSKISKNKIKDYFEQYLMEVL